jgi:4,5-dihydroxyphthalate decarboxylase
MTQPRLNVAIATYGHTKNVKSGAAAIAGVEPHFVEVVPIIGAFRRMVRDVEFDVCEMAPTTYMIARALGAPFIALPIFLMRRFHHGGFVVRPDSGIKVPKDLEGKKVEPAGTGRRQEPSVTGGNEAFTSVCSCRAA